MTHRFSIGGHKGYITAATDEATGRVVRLELRMAKAGGVLRGLTDCLAATITLGLQHGIPLEEYTAVLARTRFEPAGHTQLGYAESIADYIARWLSQRFPERHVPQLPDRGIEGDTCSVCGAPETWPVGDACPDCGHIAATTPARRLGEAP